MSEALLAAVDKEFDGSVERLCELLRIPSVGTDPTFNADTRRAADWLVDQLRGLGFHCELCETPGQPVVLGHFGASNGNGRHILYYGHYDVQPADPLELWNSPPFEPTLVDGPNGRRVVARGAVDDKGQVMTWIEAFRAWIDTHGSLPFDITVFIEGEEEGSSVNLEPFMRDHVEELKADVCIISDTGMPGPDRPAVTTLLRGIVYIEVTLQGPAHDLHSGMFGGAVINPLNALSKLIAGLHDDKGRVTLDGFYDGIIPPTEKQLADWRASGFDDDAFLATAGLDRSHGEEGYSVLERIWARPTLDVNGMWGGYTGEGSKTVIPARASAKLSCRLVPGQDPVAVNRALRTYFERNKPEGTTIRISDFGNGAPIRVSDESVHVQAARRAAGRVFPHEAVTIGCGGSIPVAASVADILGMDTLLLGFGLDDDRVHSPNEKFDLVCFERGIKTHACLIDELAKG
ncbi:MAG: dipeptidase [Geminicoccaceae bacterium]